MNELDEELRDVKREIIESRGLIIKTNNLTNALAADVKSIGKRQQTFERRSLLNGAAGNLLFVVVTLAVVKVAWDLRVESAEREVARAREDIQRRTSEVADLEKQSEARAKAESAAMGFYELLRAGKKKEFIDAFASLQKERLTRAERAFFGEEVQRAKSQLALAAYHAGLENVRASRWHEAIVALEETLRYDDTGTHAPAARLHVARAYRHLNRHKDAIPILTKLAEASADPDVLDDATFLLAECFIEIQAYNDAKTTLRSFVRRYPKSPLVNDAKMTLADLEARH
ncbi:MAG: tetratricopeptide repeat protein [Myxococcales bacterium]|nr:tetratricopeptide repeat protein [Myxococcales bacterium]